MLRTIATQFSGLNVMILKYVDEQKGVEFLGSGFVCHNSGSVLTAAHILNPSDEFCVLPILNVNEYHKRTLDNVHTIKMKLVRFESSHDVALLSPVPAGAVTCNVPAEIFARSSEGVVGASVAYMGFPYAGRGLHTLKVSQSVVCGKSLSENGVRQLHFDANVHEGNSGGPVIDVASGRIIGIVSGSFSPTGRSGAGIIVGGLPLGTESTISFATDISYGADLLRQEGLHV